MRKDNKKNIIIAIIIFLIIVAVSIALNINKEDYKEVKLSQVVAQLENKNIKELEIDKNDYILSATLKNDKKIKASTSEQDYEVISEKYIVPQAAKGIMKVNISKDTFFDKLLVFLPSILMILIFGMILLIYFGKGMFGSNEIQTNKTNVAFKDVAGMDEEKKELEEIVDFLKNPERYRNIGAKIPKGVLLVGKPGCGKTHISKAVAGEANVPFFSCSGSDFVEMFVGLGASRVRSLFKKARKNAPCIIFIDEIDAIGKKRESRFGGNDEKEGTLNQILVEMDGFKESQGIIVLAATNRPDILDPALTRAGRFDRQIVINLPDIKGREEIFDIYCEGKVLADDVNKEVLAKRTPGFAPADIANLMNEAAILAVRYNKTAIDMDIIEKSITKLIAGPEKKSRVINEKEKYLTAIHESGHAICSRYLDMIDPVHQITIIPHGYGAGGFTMTLPTEDKLYATKESMKQEIIDLLGGRAAELIIFNDISTGASNDIQRATQIASDMVTKYGFSDTIGVINYDDSENSFLGKDYTPFSRKYSENIQNSIDAEIRSIMNQGLADAKQILNTHKKELKAVADSLMTKESLTGEEFNQICDDIINEEKE